MTPAKRTSVAGPAAPQLDAIIICVYLVLGIVRSISLYLSVALLFCIWMLDVGFGSALARATNAQSFADSFLSSGFLALPVLLVTTALSALLAFTRRRRADVLDIVLGGLGYAFINPFHGLRAPLTNKRMNDLTGVLWILSRVYSIIHFCWAIALLTYVTLGLIAVAR